MEEIMTSVMVGAAVTAFEVFLRIRTDCWRECRPAEKVLFVGFCFMMGTLSGFIVGRR